MTTLRLFEPNEILISREEVKIADLEPLNNFKLLFRDVRDYFAGNVTGITRDETIAQNMMRLLFCKIYDEKTSSGIAAFSNRRDEDYNKLKARIDQLFENVKLGYQGVFDETESIELHPKDLPYIVSKLERYSILNADRDVIGDAFEELIGTSFRGNEGQFFTPRNVVQMMIDILSPGEGEIVLDPACGSGGFLTHTSRYLIAKSKKARVVGIDKDRFLVKIAKIYLSLIGNDDFQVHCENSLEAPANWNDAVRSAVKFNQFDVILTNPPFGAKIPVLGKELLSQYQLGRKWEFQNKWRNTGVPLSKQSPQVLFIERCVQLLRDGGRLGIVLPDGIFGNPSDRYIWEYISSVASITGIVSLPQETFQPSTHTKTSVLFLQKSKTVSTSVFMGIASSVGHDKNGKPLYKLDETQVIDDDLPIIAKNFQKTDPSTDQRGFRIESDQLYNHIFIPEYYNPEISKELKALEVSGRYSLISIGELIGRGVLKVTRGNEIGSRLYGSGEIPFVRTTDIVNWEIKFDPVKAVSEQVYNQYKKYQDIRERDILLVSDGTFLIGRTAMVTALDSKIIIQSHIKKIRVQNEDFIDPYYLFYLLNSRVVKRQIDSKTFVQATISTIGNRLSEVVLPIHTNSAESRKIAMEIRSIFSQKSEIRRKTIEILNNGV